MNNAITKTLTSGLMHGIISMYNENRKAIGRVISVDVLYNNCTIEFSHGQQRCEYQDVKPLLFPMSSLTKEIKFGGERFMPALKLKGLGSFVVEKPGNMIPNKTKTSCAVIDQLTEWHFNVFNLSADEFIEVNETNNPYI